jgi:DNA-binding NtrC family response regulator
MRILFAQLARIAHVDAPVLIEGETGSGKEVVANAIHACSPRAGGPFHVVDCGARHIDDDRLSTARGGTLLFDHVGELPLDAQPQLLRAVESREVRILAATNHDLAKKVQRGTFRADLYYRLAVARVHVPPLRDRRDDIPLLIEHFVRELAIADGRTLTANFLSRATRHTWPGNVRELRNAVERYLLATEPSTAELPPSATILGDVDCGVPFKAAKQMLLEEFDRKYIIGLLELHRGNLSAAARAAGIKRASIYKVIRRLGVDPRDFEVVTKEPP